MRTLFRGSIALLLVGLLAALGACTSDEARFDEHLERATRSYEEGEPRVALIELRNALRIRPDDPEVNFRIARLTERMLSFPDAIFFYRETQRLDPTRSDAAIGEALLVMWNEPERAEALVKKVLDRDPSYTPAYGALADLELHRGNSQAALVAALTASELEPDSGLWTQKLGLVYAARIHEARAEGETVPDADYAQAAKTFQRAHEQYATAGIEGTWRPLFQRARILASWPDHQAEALEAFRAVAQAADASGSEAVQQQAYSAIEEWARVAGAPAVRRDALEKLTGLGVGPMRAWIELAQMEARAGNSAEAVYERMLDRRGDEVEAHLLYAGQLAASGDADGAIAHLKQTADRGIEPAAALTGQIELLRQLRRNEEADVVYEELQAVYGNHPRAMRAAAQRAIGERRLDDAVDLLQRLAEREDSATVQRLLALAEQRRGNSEEALRASNRAIGLAGGPTPALLSARAQIEEAVGDWASVLASLRQIRQERPLTTQERLMATRALYSRGADVRARRLLERVLEEEGAPPRAALLYSAREAAKDPEATRKVLERMRERYPRAPALTYELVRLDQEAGRSDEAMARIDAFAAETGQASVRLLMARAQINAQRGEVSAAQQDALRVFEAAPNMQDVIPLLISLYEQQGELDEVIASFEEADQVGALAPASRMLLARLYLQKGDEAKARPLLEAIVAERGDLAAAKNDLAYLLAKEGIDLDRALTLAKEAQQGLGGDPAVADTVGYVYLRKNLNGPALDQFRNAIGLSTASGTARPEYHYHSGLALRALGRDREAVAALEAALALDVEFPEADRARQELEAARAAVDATGGDEAATS